MSNEPVELRVAACQILTYADVEASTDKVLVWMERAAAEVADAVVFPEACLCGYAAGEEYWRTAEPDTFAAAEARVAAAAGRLNLAVVVGTIHWEDGALLNSLLILGRDGSTVGRYAKTHLAEKWPSPGRHLPVYDVAGVPSCFIICHDVRYPELVRLPAAAGARICYFCSNESGLVQERKLSAYRAMPVARATENGIYVVMANAPGDPDSLRSPSQSHGNSKIIHPDGNVVAEAGFFEECLVTATLDLSAADRSMARRAVEDDTLLKEWMAQGMRLVSVHGHNG